MILDNATRVADAPGQASNIVYCDGGLCNRLNALIYALMLRARFGHEWSLAWPQNNWCGAAFHALFDIDMTVLSTSLLSYVQLQQDYLFLLHENQCGFRPERIIYNHTLTSMEAFEVHLNGGKPVFYYHNLFPHPMDVALLRKALGHLRIRPAILERARVFCRRHQIDGNVKGLHIRKTDFGNAVNESQLFDAVAVHPGRFFVCSDDREVNQKFAALANCCVLEKSHFPRKLLQAGDWNAPTTDSEGRSFPYNIERPEESVVDALVDLLILSATTPLRTSGSTFLGMATIFNAVAFFTR